MEMESSSASSSSCDSIWDDSETETNIEDKTTCDEKLSIKTESHAGIKKTVKRSKTIPLITPSMPIVSVNCNEAIDQNPSKSNKDLRKQRIKYAKKPKMCTVCGECGVFESESNFVMKNEKSIDSQVQL